MTNLRPRQQGVIAWLILILVAGMGAALWSSMSIETLSQRQMRKTMLALSMAQQALLAYAEQSLAAELCGFNCPRPGDLPCPDRNNDGVAEGTCSNSARLGRLPWKTLGVGDIRDGSGEHLWYAVSDRYKNNPRKLPLNLDTPGSWSIATSEGLRWDAMQGQGVVAVVIAPMQPLIREDGWRQQRVPTNVEVAWDYLDKSGTYDNARVQEDTAYGFVVAPKSVHFNDVVWPITASQIHQTMQKQVLSEVKRSLRCSIPPCKLLPAPASIQDDGCLGNGSLSGGQCLPSAQMFGRLPVDASAHWPWAVQHVLDGQAQHHWLQQNGWREYIFYMPGNTAATIVIAGDRLPGQLRAVPGDKLQVSAYLESSTLSKLSVADAAGLPLKSNDVVEKVGQP